MAPSSRVLVAESNPALALAVLLRAWEVEATAVLVDPALPEARRAAVVEQVRPDQIIGWEMDGVEGPPASDPEIWIPTGGSGGTLAWARHTSATLRQAAEGLRTFLGGGVISAVVTLPWWHVSGWMPVVRALLSGGTIRVANWRQLPSGLEVESLSLVPTQLAKLLADGQAERLLTYGTIFVGGAGLPREVAQQARTLRLPVRLTYGMTETAAMVTCQEETAFLDGDDSCGRALPHAEVSVEEATGRLLVRADSLCRGYVNRFWPGSDPFPTSDRGRIEPTGRVFVEGRLDRVIVSGGENVDLNEVEGLVRNWPEILDVVLRGRADSQWGTRIEALAELAPGVNARKLEEMSRERLGPAERPQRWLVPGGSIRTVAGKPCWGEIGETI